LADSDETGSRDRSGNGLCGCDRDDGCDDGDVDGHDDGDSSGDNN